MFCVVNTLVGPKEHKERGSPTIYGRHWNFVGNLNQLTPGSGDTLGQRMCDGNRGRKADPLEPSFNFSISLLRILYGYLRPICERRHYEKLEVCRSALKCAGGQHPHTFKHPLSFLPDNDFPINTHSVHVPTLTWNDPTRGGSLSLAMNKSARSSSNIPPSPSSSAGVTVIVRGERKTLSRIYMASCIGFGNGKTNGFVRPRTV